MKKILIAYATNSGTTPDVARRIGDQFPKEHFQVDVLPLDQIAALDGYDGVVLGAPMIVGWHRAALAFLKQNQAALSRLPVALFLTCISLTQTGETQVDGAPLFIDPNLPKAPAKAGRLSFRERHTSPANYLRPILKAAPAVRPVSVAIFGGRLDLYRLKWYQTLFVMLIIRAQPGEKRNWKAIEAWAAGLPALLV